ncbi:uncharacterized protein LOC132565042 [Ylistrum balloti]|uniref:uncharacterized protein LOC132565042 n=1 Tax=Ylistrum balloti TaxID=509963 RepID=UPI002905BE7F|nr:uncharacterized protein LOC132565042 [Ylistrum balloti]
MAVATAVTTILLGSLAFLVLVDYCACLEGNVHNFRCYTARYRGRCMERIYPKNVTQCCAGYVGRYCDNYVQDEFYFASTRPRDDVDFLKQRTQEYRNNRRGPKGEKGERGPEGFLGMPGSKGEPGSTVNKGQKGAPGISVKGERGKRGRRGKPGRRGRKGNTGPIGPPGMPGLPDTGSRRKTAECNCSDLERRVTILETLVRNITEGRLVIPRAGHPVQQTPEIPTVEDRSSAVTMETVGNGAKSKTIPTSENTPEVTGNPTIKENLDTEITTMLTTKDLPVKCNNSNRTPDCPSTTFCKTSVPMNPDWPPPIPYNTNFSLTSLNELTCCSPETLEFAFRYYKKSADV